NHKQPATKKNKATNTEKTANYTAGFNVHKTIKNNTAEKSQAAVEKLRTPIALTTTLSVLSICCFKIDKEASTIIIAPTNVEGSSKKPVGRIINCPKTE